MILQFGALSLICNQEMSLAKRTPILKFGDLISHSESSASEYWGGKNYGSIQLQFLSEVIRAKSLEAVRGRDPHGLILDESTTYL